MKLIALISLAPTVAQCSPTANTARFANELATFKLAAVEECGELGVMDWDAADLPANTNISSLRKCKKHPSELGITSPKYNPAAEAADLTSTSPVKRGQLVDLVERTEVAKREAHCYDKGGRGTGLDYDYGCDNGWCWRNCGGPFYAHHEKKKWCWLAYEAGNGGWTPCGGWYDCEWSYNNKNAKCAKGDCKACGCGC